MKSYLFISLFITMIITHGTARCEVISQDIDKCYRFTSANKAVDADINLFCERADSYIASGKDSQFYLQVMKIMEGANGYQDIHSFRIRILEVKPLGNYSVEDMYDLVKAALKISLAAKVKALVEAPSSGYVSPGPAAWFTKSQILLAVYSNFAVPNDEKKQQRATAEAARLRQVQRDKDDADARYAEAQALEAQGYKEMSVSDVQLDGNSLVGKGVVIRGYIQAIDNKSALVFNNKNDTNGIRLDISGGDRDIRRFILERCSDLQRSCVVRFKAHVTQGSDFPELKLD